MIYKQKKFFFLKYLVLVSFKLLKVCQGFYQIGTIVFIHFKSDFKKVNIVSFFFNLYHIL